MTDLVERLRHRTTNLTKEPDALCQEAATALEAKDKELAELRAKLERADFEADYYFDLYEAKADDAAKLILDRAETAERERDHFKGKAHEYFGMYDVALRGRDEAREALKAVEPYLDAITCYASTTKEHEGNRVAQLVRAAAITGEKP